MLLGLVALGVGELAPLHQVHAVLGQFGFNLFREAVGLLLEHGQDHLSDDLDLIGGGEVVGAAVLGPAGLDLPLQGADALLVVLVEIGVEDGEEGGAFEQRGAGVERFVEDTAVELEPGDFAVDEGLVLGDGQGPGLTDGQVAVERGRRRG